MAFDAPELIGPAPAVALWGDWITRRRQQFALYAPDGTPYRHSGFHSSQFRSAAEKEPDFGLARKSLGGPVLFAGQTPPQFGHVLMNALGRLWALERLPAETRLYYVTKKPQRARYHPHLTGVLDLLGIKNELVVSRHNLRIEQAYCASDLFGEVYGGLGAPEFHNWIDRRLPPKGPVEPGKAIYVTRGRLGPGQGRYACEDHLETLLADRGYEIFAPEQHDLATQVDRYQRAEKLIFAEGSALHLYGMVAQPGQTVAVIRRRAELPRLIEYQLHDRPGRRIAAIDAVSQVYWPPRPGDHLAVSVLDFERLGDALASNGLISSVRGWVAPSDKALELSMKAGLEPDEGLLSEAERARYVEKRRAAMDGRRR